MYRSDNIYNSETTHDFAYIINVYAEIIKLLEKRGITYSDWECLNEHLQQVMMSVSTYYGYAQTEIGCLKKILHSRDKDETIKYTDFLLDVPFPPFPESPLEDNSSAQYNNNILL